MIQLDVSMARADLSSQNNNAFQGSHEESVFTKMQETNIVSRNDFEGRTPNQVAQSSDSIPITVLNPLAEYED